MAAEPTPQSASGRGAFAEAERLAGEGDLQRAEAAYGQADEAGHPTAPALLGLLAEGRGETGEAERLYRRADERGDGLGALRLGLLLAGAGGWDEAREAFARAEERGTAEPPAALLEGLGGAGRQSGAGEEAAARRPFPLASPVLIGAVTVLIALTAVFLSYSANRGLPFVPTRELKLDIANGSNLVPGNDVREGGYRIGLISDLRPIELPNGTPGAELTLKLDKAHARVPVDSTATIFSRSVLGLKYVDLHVGRSPHAFSDGGTMPLGHTSVPVQFDDVYSTFNKPTRRAIDRDLVGYGDVLTGRGSSLNDTFAALPSLLGYLRPVARYLSQPQTQLLPFFNNLERFMGAIAPVAATNAKLFGDMAITLGAIDRNPADLKATIAESPPTLNVSTDSLKAQLPFLHDFTAFARAMKPATVELRGALPDIVPAVEVGTRVLARTPSLNHNLQQFMVSLKNLATNPGTDVALNALSATTTTLNPMIRYLGPFVTVCNTWNYWWTYLGEHLSEATNFGFGQRVLLNSGDATQPDNVGSLPASEPANGQNGGPEYLHDPSYGAAIDAAGNADCENGQRGYPRKLNHFDPQGRNLVTDIHVPADQGTTFTGLSRVPPGETFTRAPQTGPLPAPNPANP